MATSPCHKSRGSPHGLQIDRSGGRSLSSPARARLWLGLESRQASSPALETSGPYYFPDAACLEVSVLGSPRRGLRRLAFQVSAPSTAAGLSSPLWSADRDTHATTRLQSTAAIRDDPPVDWGNAGYRQTASASTAFNNTGARPGSGGMV
jgi:hypothetical protein